MLDIVETKDLKSAAFFTLDNMKEYYEMHSVDWGADDIYSATKELSNFDIQLHGQRIGVLRLSFEHGRCQLRDIQVSTDHQSKGYGAEIIAHVVEMARKHQSSHIELKVFQRSPAHRLYSRLGFKIDSEDDRFYYMSLAVSL
jgi:GNAT superfamily N-acetyltransferase